MDSANSQDFRCNQSILGRKGMVVFLVLIDMFIPLSTDMYLPSLPLMSDYFHATTFTMNLTLSLFFLFYAFGILLWGPPSDRYGRKPILFSGVVLYVVGSLACCLAGSVTVMIVARIVQGIGAGAITSIAMAIVKDSYTGEKRQKILALIQAVGSLAPLIAPIIGAAVLHFFGWRAIFLVLAAIGIICLVMTALYKETLPDEERNSGGIFRSFHHLYLVARNKSLIIPLLIFSCMMIPFMGHISASSYIYENYFGLSATFYSIFFACNALISMLGPASYIRIFMRRSKRMLAYLTLTLALFSGIALLCFGRIAPLAFFLCYMFFSYAAMTNRPYSSNLLLDQQAGDTGSVSALITFAFAIFGFIGMLLASSDKVEHLVFRLGLTIVIVAVIQLVSWTLFLRSRIPCEGVK